MIRLSDLDDTLDAHRPRSRPRPRLVWWAAALTACAALARGDAVSADDGPSVAIHSLPNRVDHAWGIA